MSPMKSGLHGPNAPFTEDDWNIVRIMVPESIELFANQYTVHGPEVVDRCYQLGVRHFMYRLHDTLEPDGTILHYKHYAQRAFSFIQAAYPKGIRLFRLCNEPNWMHKTKAFGPYQYVWFMKRAVTELRRLLFEADLVEVKLICPPLSYSPALWRHEGNPTAWTLDEWRGAFKFSDPNGDVFDQHTLYEFFDYAGATVYWQYARQMMDGSFGMCYITVANDARESVPDMQVIPVEYANSLHDVVDNDGQPVYKPGEVNALRMAQYPDWVRFAQSFGCPYAYGYICGGTPDWEGFHWTPSLAKIMSRSTKGK